MEIELENCKEENCIISLNLSNRYYCSKCKLCFCNKHIFEFAHICIKEDNGKDDKLPPIKVVHPKCCLDECLVKMNLSNRFECRKCNKIYCMSHRHDFSHKCLSSSV